MARLSSLIVLLLIAAAGQAAPAGQASTTILAAPFSIGPNGLPNLPTSSGPSGPLTMTELGGNVVACPSQVAFLLSSTTYLDCLEPVSTITLGTSSASALPLIQLTISAGSTLEGLPLVYSDRTDTATLLPFSTGQVSSASSASQTRGSASSFGLSSSPSGSTQPGGNTISSIISSPTSGVPQFTASVVSSGQSSSTLQPGGTGTASSVVSSGRSSSTLQPGGPGTASVSIISSASSSSTQDTGAASASGASHISSADSLSTNRPTTQGTASDSSTGRSGSNASGNVPSVTSGPSSSQRLSVSQSDIPPTTSASNGSTLPPAPAPSTYSIDGVGFTGNPSSLVAGSTTLTPGGAPLITSSHTFSIPVSATGGQINVDGTLTTLPSPRTGSGSSSAVSAPAPSTYSIDGVGFTGNPSSLIAGSTTLTPGGPPLITSSHTFSIPVLATGGQINVDGTLTTLPSPQTGSGSSSAASAPARSSMSSQSNSTSQSIPGIIVGGMSSTSLTTNAQGSGTSAGASLPGASTSAVSSNSQTPTVTSTETAAPPGASAETLVSGAFLFNQWITTTKPGSSTPTVIPIILPPGGGPPIALWGFLPGPPPGGDLPNPPALEINIPKLKIPCIKLFGLKFGDCSSDDDSNSENPTNNPTDTQPTHTEPSNTQSDSSTAKSQSSPSSRSSSNSPSSQSSSQSRSSSSSGSQSCSSMTATITQVSCATTGTSTSCTTQFNTNVGCSASGSAITSGSCVAKTTVGSSTTCCSSVKVSSGSTVCAFADLTQWDMNSPPSDLQTAPPSAQLASEFSAYLATHSGASGAAPTTGSASSTRYASSTGPASVSATSSAVSLHNSASSAGLTTSGSSFVASPIPTNVASASSAAANADPLCIANGEFGRDECVCSTGTIIVTISSYFNPTSNVCGYTTIPSTPVVSTPMSSTPKPTGAIFTYTDPNYGYVVACDSTYTSEVAGYVITECTGSSSTISTDASIVSFDSVYLAAESSSSAASAASVASVSAAAATPTARILITYFTYENDDVYLYQYRAYDGVPDKEIAYCSTASPISFVNLDKGNGDPNDLPTNQLPKFTTHGIKDCTYSSPSSSEAGTVSCPGWANPVQCTAVVGSQAQEYQCPTFQGGTEQQPIVDCDWGANP